jgi:hypothetical protein
MKAISCKKCRENWEKAIAQQIYDMKYEYFAEASDAVARGIMIAFVAALDRRQYSKQYIRKMYEDMLLILDYPEVFGKQIESEELAKEFSEKYGIDFDRARLKIEDKKEFMYRNMKGGVK